jgi:predicted 3-demethylubiquinone-9 3-methyltransferase (glyoxalase superfamily)
MPSGYRLNPWKEYLVTRPIAPCLWFSSNAEEAVNYYVSVFDDSKVLHVDRFNETGPAPDAPVVFIEFQINGQPFQAINGGDEIPFSWAISFSISCRDQAEVDRYWDRFIADGGEESQCGWLKDKYGVSWQIVPERLMEMQRSKDRDRAGKAMRKMLTMRKLNVAELETAYNS